MSPFERAVEVMAQAADPIGWAWYDKAKDDHPARPAGMEYGCGCEPATPRAWAWVDEFEDDAQMVPLALCTAFLRVLALTEALAARENTA
jgi:hypothetical protein